MRTKAIVRLCTHLAHCAYRSQVPNRQSCDCINFVRATDPFLGSGSTLIAGEKTDHVCRGIEFDPKFVDVIVKRYIVNIKWLFVLKLKFFLVQSSLVQSSLKEYNKKDKIQKELPT